MNIPLTIQEIGTISPDEYFGAIDKMADLALADACTTANPRVPKKEGYCEDLQEIVVILMNLERLWTETVMICPKSVYKSV